MAKFGASGRFFHLQRSPFQGIGFAVFMRLVAVATLALRVRAAGTSN